ncbi:hypothetical protein [Tahibacter aquaticus]|uniref:hypothetical protein n=1 Tax=Tahibacter aquaticus TaxID=520092 RepID=UPI00105D003B|nr:hypothetical protein [Tahibacter aquaticus]
MPFKTIAGSWARRSWGDVDVSYGRAGTVFLADLRGTLADAADGVGEIHPNAHGFARLAGKVDGVVRGAIARKAST